MSRALLFDMNGVVVDDMAFHERAWRALAERHGRSLTTEEFRRVMSGRRSVENVEHVFGAGLSPSQLEAYRAEKEAAYRQAFRPHLAPLPGLVELLEAARTAGWRIALATSAPKENIDFVLDGLDLRRRFDSVVGEADVRRAKPDPEIYLTAAARVEADPSECIVFEDSLAGVASGLAALMPVVGVTTTHVAEELGGCALVIADFCRLTLEQLATLV